MEVTLNVTHKTSVGSGLYSTYYMVSETIGIKVLKNEELDEAFDEAVEEYSYIKQAESSGITPKGIGIVKVKDGAHLDGTPIVRIGILMTHCPGMSLYQWKRENEEFDSGYWDEDDYSIDDIEFAETELCDYIYDKMKACGLNLRDRHAGNIIVETDAFGAISKVWCIDFSPSYCCVRED